MVASLSNSGLRQFANVVEGLNSLFAARAACALGYRTAPLRGGRVSPWHRLLAESMVRRLACYDTPPADLTPEKALRELLSTKDLYSQEPANLAPYNSEKLKVCRGETRPKPALSLLPESAACFLRSATFCLARSLVA